MSLQFVFSFGGTSAVLGHEAELPLAIRSHRFNWKMTDVVSAVKFYDDRVRFSENLEAPATAFGITDTIMRKLAENNVSTAVTPSCRLSCVGRPTRRAAAIPSRRW